jgi:hypothetical protein
LRSPTRPLAVKPGLTFQTVQVEINLAPRFVAGYFINVTKALYFQLSFYPLAFLQ